MRANWGEFKNCFEEAARTEQTDPMNLGARLRFTIGPSGGVREASAENFAGSELLDHCLVAVTTRIAFPAPDGGSEVNVTYPFVF